MKVSNPLTIIAIFAGLAETFATAVLLVLPEKVQMIFIWYVMLFPVILVLAFFGVLYRKPTVFYAPSDYPNPSDFLRVMLNKIEKEAAQAIDEIPASDELTQEAKSHIKRVLIDKVREAKSTLVGLSAPIRGIYASRLEADREFLDGPLSLESVYLTLSLLHYGQCDRASLYKLLVEEGLKPSTAEASIVEAELKGYIIEEGGGFAITPQGHTFINKMVAIT